MLNKILELQKAYPSDDAKVMAGLRESGLVAAIDSMGYTNFWPRVVAASGGTSEGIVKLLREMEPLFPRVAEIMALPQPEYEIQAKQFFADCSQISKPILHRLNFIFTGFRLGGQNFQPGRENSAFRRNWQWYTPPWNTNCMAKPD